MRHALLMTSSVECSLMKFKLADDCIGMAEQSNFDLRICDIEDIVEISQMKLYLGNMAVTDVFLGKKKGNMNGMG